MNDFVKMMCVLARNGKLPVERTEPCAESKWMYHWAVTDPATGRVIIGTGSTYSGDDFSWGSEIKPAEKSSYI